MAANVAPALLSLLGSQASPKSSNAESGAKSKSGDIDGYVYFGDQIVNGKKDSLWTTLIMTAGALFLAALLIPKKKK